MSTHIKSKVSAYRIKIFSLLLTSVTSLCETTLFSDNKCTDDDYFCNDAYDDNDNDDDNDDNENKNKSESYQNEIFS
ncbi:hypothetical protein EMCG_05165, partial [[Emmonsia] crescens]